MLPGYEITTTDKADQNCYTNDPPQLDMLDILAMYNENLFLSIRMTSFDILFLEFSL